MSRKLIFSLKLQRWWPLLRRILTIGFFVLVAGLLIRQAGTVDWREVTAAIGQLQLRAIALAGLLTMVSYSIHASYDLIGRIVTGHHLSARQVMFVALVSYAFNLNLGAVVGGLAFRYRLYSRLGLSANVITRVLGTAIVTNWSGYCLLAGILLASGTATLPEGWIGGGVLRLVGVGMLAALLVGFLVVWLSRQREFTVLGHPIPLPSRTLALAQWVISAVNWMTIASVVYVLLPVDIPYVLVLGALLLAAVAGMISHVPAGLGVLEAVFLAVLGGAGSRYELLAGLLAFRAVYYLAPLPVAAVLFGVGEARWRRAGPPASDGVPRQP